MDDFSVFLTHRKPATCAPISDPEDIADRLMDELVSHHGAVSVSPDTWDAVVSVDASNYSDALDRAVQVVTVASGVVGLDVWPIVDARVVRGDVLDEENRRTP